MNVIQAISQDYSAISRLVSEWRGTENVVSQSFFNDYLARERQHLAVAKDFEGVVVGYIGWTVWHPVLSWPHPTCFIEELFVTTSMRRQGVANALVRHVMDWAEANGIASVHLETSETPALRLYEKLGFRSVNTSLYRRVKPSSPVTR